MKKFFESIKKFFENGTVKIVEAVVIALASLGLIVGGLKVEEIEKIPAMAGGIVTGVEAIVTLVQGIIALVTASKNKAVKEE